ncbi:hypothetical protein [Halorussus caseinilyticus]|uniref:DUF8050 domain-containing protein n=1 Tax=Halorussus caseinilyticus TaxID=3034025 RepID=A0ABD5WQM5_9EURY
MDRPTSPRRLLALLALFLAPWTVLSTGDLVFAWGLATLDPFHVTTLTDYLFVYTRGLPNRLLAWPVAVVLYLLAVGNAALGWFAPDSEDRRVTGVCSRWRVRATSGSRSGWHAPDCWRFRSGRSCSGPRRGGSTGRTCGARCGGNSSRVRTGAAHSCTAPSRGIVASRRARRFRER